MKMRIGFLLGWVALIFMAAHYWGPAVAALRAAAPLSDDFNQNNLASRWTFINPPDDGWLAVTGVGSQAQLELNLPEGQPHDIWNQNKAIRVMQPSDDTDFTVSARFETHPNQTFQMQGIVVEQDSANWLRFDNHSRYGKEYIFASVTTAGKSQTKINIAPVLGSGPLYLKVTRLADTWYYAYSQDGLNWTLAVSFTQALAVAQVGLFAGNQLKSGSLAPAFTAKIDYIEFAADPIAAEDGAVQADTQAPFQHTFSDQSFSGGFAARWFTDEPAAAYLEYGPDASYGVSLTQPGAPTYTHAITAAGLGAAGTYHYRICAADSGGRLACSADRQIEVTAALPVIEIWYGATQNFGAQGQPQPYINILGNISATNSISAAYYALNDGAPVDLNLGPDGRRLENLGDFNADITTADLLAGQNQVRISAETDLGAQAAVTVTVHYTPGTVWPAPYNIHWGDLATDAEILDAAQVVDGKWTLTPDGIRTLEPGYDRLIAIGDRTWTDYEARAAITLHSDLDWGEGVGFLFRWDGHTNNPYVCGQPLCGYFPLGDIGWMQENKLALYYGGSVARTWQTDRQYQMVMRVETEAGTTTYRLKVWDTTTETEPADWQLTRTTSTTPPDGSLLLLAHQADVTFGEVSVRQVWPYEIYLPLVTR